MPFRQRPAQLTQLLAHHPTRLVLRAFPAASPSAALLQMTVRLHTQHLSRTTNASFPRSGLRLNTKQPLGSNPNPLFTQQKPQNGSTGKHRFQSTPKNGSAPQLFKGWRNTFIEWMPAHKLTAACVAAAVCVLGGQRSKTDTTECPPADGEHE